MLYLTCYKLPRELAMKKVCRMNSFELVERETRSYFFIAKEKVIPVVYF